MRVYLLCACFSAACHGSEPVPSTDKPDGPPPIAGGTLLILPDGNTAAASDPDRDIVWIANLQEGTAQPVSLSPHDEPGRLVADREGHVHVALRRGGAIATINPATLTLIHRTDVCPAPRGLSYDSATDQVYVACVGGELASLSPSDGAVTRTVHLDGDLRDVLVQSGQLVVTRFRSAEVLFVDVDGRVASRFSPAPVPSGSDWLTSSVAWRAVATPAGGVAVLHQRATTAVVNVSGRPGQGFGYGGDDAADCNLGGSVVKSAVSVFSSANEESSVGLRDIMLGVDLAVTPDGTTYAVVSPSINARSNVVMFTATNTIAPEQPGCAAELRAQFGLQAIAVVALDNKRFLVQTRWPSALHVVDTFGAAEEKVSLGTPRTDAGQDLFHMRAGADLACASCHPEGGDDGRVWQFDIGPRRTMSLRGGLHGTEPFHWIGEDLDFASLMSDVFSERMHGLTQTSESIRALSSWLETIPRVAPSISDVAAVARGQDIFESAAAGCSSCHNGAHFTNNATVDVGTGGAFQVPRLDGLASRPPYLHDGRAVSLRDRFGSLGGGDAHGQTSTLSATQIDDLVAYLLSL